MERLRFKIKLSFWLACGVVLLCGQFSVFAVYIVSVLIHELAHYFVAVKFFYKCERIELSAFGLTLYGDFEEAVNREQMLIAAAGPLVNLALSVLLFAAWYIYPEIYVFTREFLYANLSIGLINLLPCYPLDGGKALIGLLTKKKSYGKALLIAKTLTAAISGALFSAFVVSLFLTKYPLYALGVFSVLLFSSLLEQTDKKIYSRLSRIFGKKKRLKYGMEKKRLVFLPETTLSAALCKLDGAYIYEIEIADENLKTLAVFSETEFYDLAVKFPLETEFSKVLKVV